MLVNLVLGFTIIVNACFSLTIGVHNRGGVDSYD